MNRKKPYADLELCMACNICIVSCPFSCLEAVRTGGDSYGKAFPVLVRPEDCTGCGICASSCPFSVISMVEP